MNHTRYHPRQELFMTRTPFTVFIVMLLAAPPAFAQGRRGQTPQPPQPAPAASESAPRVETAGEKEEKISQTSHTVRLDGREIKYTATAGTLPIRLDNRSEERRVGEECRS